MVRIYIAPSCQTTIVRPGRRPLWLNVLCNTIGEVVSSTGREDMRVGPCCLDPSATTLSGRPTETLWLHRAVFGMERVAFGGLRHAEENSMC